MIYPDIPELLTQEEFDQQYPDAFSADNNCQFHNIPKAMFIVISKKGEKEIYTAIDNRTYDAWTEDFMSYSEAMKWFELEWIK